MEPSQGRPHSSRTTVARPAPQPLSAPGRAGVPHPAAQAGLPPLAPDHRPSQRHRQWQRRQVRRLPPARAPHGERTRLPLPHWQWHRPGDGQIEIGPRWTQQIQGGHVRSLAGNEDSIGICLVGNFEVSRPTTRQLAALVELVKFLRQEVLPRRPEFLVHRELSGESTLCPGRLFPASRMHRLCG
ncbi:MAG: N-acetylmuramoyl-L-alanine amidase [Verrucomicrobiales bacterium]|nr:N-acetylmuramoyl-L-alanine amidase [Verrucomicrobiales bacterium]